MPCDLKENIEEGMLEIRLYGEVTFVQLKEVRMEIGRLCREKGYRRVLVNTLETMDHFGTSTMELFEFGTEVREEAQLPADLNTAVLIDPRTETGKNWQFLANVEVNRNFCLKEFENIDEAKEWLNK